jgi:hypothetical protein
VNDILAVLQGAGAYSAVFIGMGFVITWLLGEMKRQRATSEQLAERLLSERDKRISEALETAHIVAETTQRVTEHTRVLEKVLDRQRGLTP